MVESSRDRLVVFFEAPHKVERTLAELDLLVKRPIIVAREVTKLHEEFVEGTARELATRFREPHGEFTILVPPADSAEKAAIPASDNEIIAMFGQITESGAGSSKREVARLVGERLGLTARQVYEVMERNK